MRRRNNERKREEEAETWICSFRWVFVIALVGFSPMPFSLMLWFESEKKFWLVECVECVRNENRVDPTLSLAAIRHPASGSNLDIVSKEPSDSLLDLFTLFRNQIITFYQLPFRSLHKARRKDKEEEEKTQWRECCFVTQSKARKPLTRNVICLAWRHLTKQRSDKRIFASSEHSANESRQKEGKTRENYLLKCLVENARRKANFCNLIIHESRA